MLGRLGDGGHVTPPELILRGFGITLLAIFLSPLRPLRAQSSEADLPVFPVGERVKIASPLGLPAVEIPADNPPTRETIALGRRLFYDPILSADGRIACASCHDPEKGFTDHKAVATGIRDQTGTRSVPTVLNSAYYRSLFWDGRAGNLETQAGGPITNPIEMGNTPEAVVRHLNESASYQQEFKRAWGRDVITFEMVKKSLATFERTLLVGNSPFDRYYYGRDRNALSPAARRGLKVFTDPKRGNCASCHTIGKDYALFTDQKFHNIGIGANTDGSLADAGRYAETRDDADMGTFKTPGLRNATWTAPYMHDGSLTSLKDVIDHYIGGGNSNPHLDKQIRVLDFLSGQERGDLLEFLNSLNGPMPPNIGPPADMQKPDSSTQAQR